MGQIKILDEIVSNQIAAGEVIERPASMVKELIENSLDAGATQIDIHVEEGGISRLIITDNGCGMSSDDAVLCFSRYATSKLKSLSDLESLHSFGFRGEALASIASVSKIKLTTRQASAALGTQILIHGGKIIEVGDAGAPVGTRIEVESLFFNTPARLKFLKSPRSESSAIESIVRQAALSQPEVGFRLQIDGQVKLNIHKAANQNQQFERAVQCLGEDTRNHLFPFDAQTDLVKLTGYVAAPLATRKDSLGLFVYVNGRFVKDKQLIQAIRVAYRSLLEVGRHPIGALNIQINPEFVDVNVHPQKLEVRFSEPSRVQGHLIRLLSDFLATTPWLHTEIPVSAPSFQTSLPTVSTPSTFRFDSPRSEPMWSAAPKLEPSFGRVTPPAQQLHTLGTTERYRDLRIIGQVDQTYLILEGSKAMIVIDQHAAHERVVFEKVCAAAKLNGVPSQALLFPMSINISPMDMATLIEKKALFAPYGFEIEPFGDTQALVKATPTGLRTDALEEIVRDTLSDLRDADRPDSLQAFQDHICAQIACHSSVRAGQKMDLPEIKALLEQLDVVDYKAHCPHGRPVVRAVPFTEIGGWFHRT